LLPASIADLHVIVATRPYEHVLTAVPAHHPFRTTTPLQLSASPHAADIRDEAGSQVRRADADATWTRASMRGNTRASGRFTAASRGSARSAFPVP
jgi:hypothetical protein